MGRSQWELETVAEAVITNEKQQKLKSRHHLGGSPNPLIPVRASPAKTLEQEMWSRFGHTRRGDYDGFKHMAVTVGLPTVHDSQVSGLTLCTLSSETMLVNTCRAGSRNRAGIRCQAHHSLS